MLMMTSQILKFVDFIKTQKFRYLKNEAQNITRSAITIKGHFIAKKSFTAGITFKNRPKAKKWS